MCMSLCACSFPWQKPEPTPMPTPEPTEEIEDHVDEVEPTPTPIPLPSATSESENLYAFAMANGHQYIVDSYGRYVDENYFIDGVGNICNEYGDILIVSDNVKMYKPIRTMYFGQEIYGLTAEGNGTNNENGLTSAQTFSNCVIDLYCAPASATNCIVCFRSDNNAVVEIRPNSNAKVVNLNICPKVFMGGWG